MNEALLRTDKGFVEIYYQYVSMVYRVCFLFVKNAADAEDLTQTAFLRLLERGEPFDSEEHRKAWLLVTASNLCRDFLRHWWRRRADLDAVPEPSTEPPAVDETLERVLALPPKYKTAIYLYYYEGYTTVDIAAMLRKKESTVRGYLHTGRKLLKDGLTDDLL